MGIKLYVDGMAIEDVFRGYFPEELDPSNLCQTKVSCQGDIAVQPFYPEDYDGVAWLLLCQGPAGEPGRDEGPRLLAEQPGVLIGAEDPRSLDVIIEALVALRDRLEGHQGTQEHGGGLPGHRHQSR